MGQGSTVGLVVQPWGCTWLTDAQLLSGNGCIAFEARGMRLHSLATGFSLLSYSSS